MVQATVALRIDVDTRRGLDEGVPRLLDLFRRERLGASFFVTMGPDRSGLALRRAWRPSFLAKMWRTRALRLYGLSTVLAGTLLPARPVGAGAPALLRQIASEGHEVAPHGFDHVGWQDRVHRMSAARIRADLEAAAGAFQSVFGAAPEASAAPGWRTTPEALVVQDEFAYAYGSDVRGLAPFRPLVGPRALDTIQIPTTMATVDELLGRTKDVAGALVRSLRPGLNVLTLHAEVEGGPWLGVLRDFLAQAGRRGVALARLCDVAEAARVEADSRSPVPVVRMTVPGRSGWVTAEALPAGYG
ncbi:MAG: 4-deoxy-4-formamido-L-arabinose-phosphoundecaprenol deformylase [Candidatus Rokubacteria bacterium]|nr:4-deoxy-4-formamido-L-arabinose-phosphoundecaprenol deformylase [Candidatus Rokubacteria bacterium]